MFAWIGGDALSSGQDEEARLNALIVTGTRYFLSVGISILVGYAPIAYFVDPPGSALPSLAMRAVTTGSLALLLAVAWRRGRERLAPAICCVGLLLVSVHSVIHAALHGADAKAFLASPALYTLGLAMFVPLNPALIATAGAACATLPIAAGIGEPDWRRYLIHSSFAAAAAFVGAGAVRARRKSIREIVRAEVDARRALEEAVRAQDATRRAQSQILASERLATLGRLAAGFAHEVNTPLAAAQTALTSVAAYHAELRQSIGHPQVTDEDLSAIVEDASNSLSLANRAVGQAATQIRDVKLQTRTLGRAEERQFLVGEVLQGTLALLQHRIRHHGAPVTASGGGDILLTGDPGKLTQVLCNLLGNALDACSGATPKAPIELVARLSGGLVEIRCVDRGPGIPPELREGVFDLFVTTKERGIGTGLGLPLSREIVRNDFGGDLVFEETPGGGATFVARIPLARGAAAAADIGVGL